MVTFGREDAAPAGLTTLAGWRRFIATDHTVPRLLSRAQWVGLDAEGRVAYDEERIEHHARLGVVVTPTIRDVITEGRRLTVLNRHAVTGRYGLILSGPARTGKTTALTQMAKTVEIMHRQRFPHREADIPVLYITAPPAATPRMVAVEFARFLGLPAARRQNITDVIEAVCGVCLDAGTVLVGVDEIHNLALHTRTGADTSDMLKYFAERIPATFVYSGIDVERAGLLSGTRGEQIAGRFAMIRTGPFPRTPDWTSLLLALEGSLRLHQYRRGTLLRMDGYLHQRSSGMIGSLLRLVRSAAIQAVLDGTECITRRGLDAIQLDVAAETTAAGARRQAA